MNKHMRWSLQDAKARFSEVVRRAVEEGPQHVSVHGKEKAVVISQEEYARLTGGQRSGRTGARLIEIMQDPRLPKDFTFQRDSVYSPVRDVDHLFDDDQK